jgi:zinc-ribbon domain
MMNSATSTEPQRAADAGFHPWQFYLLLAMIAATVAVVLSRQTEPAALLLLSAAVLAIGLVGAALHRAVAGFTGQTESMAPPLGERARDRLLREKNLVLRSIKELEFDHAMGKVSETDFADISGRLRTRALALMQELDRAEAPAAAAPSAAAAATGGSQPAERRASAGPCPECHTVNEPDARFCKQCGRRLRDGAVA